MTEPKYIRFVHDGKSSSGKTHHWTVTAKGDLTDRIGEVKWFGAWRCYGFYPSEGTVFEKQCLRDIADFCEMQTKIQKGLQ